MSDSSPDVKPDGSLEYTNNHTRADNRSNILFRGVKRAFYGMQVFALQQQFAAIRLIQVVGFLIFFYGSFRLFGIGYYGMDGLGPLSRDFFTMQLLPGPWVDSPTWIRDTAFIWMGIGIVVIAISTRNR